MNNKKEEYNEICDLNLGFLDTNYCEEPIYTIVVNTVLIGIILYFLWYIFRVKKV
jgi:hypothetical protein